MNKRNHKLLLGGLLAFISIFFVHAPRAYAGVFSDFQSMPLSVPDDRGLYPGSSGLSSAYHHQYLSVAKSSINDNEASRGGIENMCSTVSLTNDADSTDGCYPNADIAVYWYGTSAPTSDVNLNIAPTARRVNNIGSDTNCQSVIDVFASAPDGSASARVKNNYPIGANSCGNTINNFAGIPGAYFKSIGTLGGGRVWVAYARISFVSSVNSQFSFRIAVADTDSSRLGYPGGSWNNYYVTKEADHHNIQFNWRPPCGDTVTGSAMYRDGNEGTSNQSYDAYIDATLNGASVNNGGSEWQNVTAGTISTGDPFGGATPKRSRMVFHNINGGNGIGFKHPEDTGNYFLSTCSVTTPPTGTISPNCSSVGTTNAQGRQFYRIYAYSATTSGYGASGTRLDDSGNLAWNARWTLPSSVTSHLNGNETVYFWYEVWNPDGSDSGTAVDDYIHDGGQGTYSNDCTDYNPTASMGISCNNVHIESMSDGNNINGDAYRYHGVVYQRNSDGSRGNAIKDFSGESYGSADIGFTPVPDTNNNHGVVVDVNINNIDNNGGRTGDEKGVASQGIGACYDATCSVSITSDTPIPGAGVGQVMANSMLTISVTINNTGDADNNPLYDDLGGNQLTFTQSGGDIGFSPIDFLGTGNTAGVGQIGLGGSATQTYRVRAPNDRAAHTMQGYADYNGRFGIYGSPADESNVPTCKTDFTTYQPYQINPVTSVPAALPDEENPAQITYTSSSNRTSGPYAGNADVSYYTGAVSSTYDSKLYYKDSATGVETPPPFQEEASSYAFGDFLKTYTWDDTLTDVAQFNHGGATGTWKMGDKYCPLFRIDNATGWQGPSSQILTAAKTSPDGCGTVKNEPFVRIYGNDAMGGGNFPGGVSPSGLKGGLYGYMRGDIAPAGSGAEYAALAIGAVDGFSSASLRTSNPLPSTGLAFANTGSLGGGLSSEQVADWYADTRMPETVKDTSATADNFSVGSWTNGTQKWVKPSDGVLNLSGSTAQNEADPDGQRYSGRRTLYVDGDVVITSNVLFQKTRVQIGDIPSLVIIAKGNVYISSGVTRIDGMLIAQPKDVSGGTNNDTTSGILYTCTRPDGSRYASTELQNTCNSKLQINGSIVAQDVRFLRTKGTLKDVPVTQVSAPEKVISGPITDTAWTVADWTEPASFKAGKQCITLKEPSDPNWRVSVSDPLNNDNVLCYKSATTLSWYWGGQPAGTECASFDNPRETPTHFWSDNFLCAPGGTGLGLQMVWDGSTPAGKSCIAILEIDWTNAESDDNAWLNGNAKLCYNVGSVTPAVPVKYQQQTYANDNAAESILMSPESYLAQPVFQPVGSQSNGKYDYIISLPPVL